MPLVTLTVIVCDLPLPCSTFGVAITAAQIAGAGVGFGVGLGIGFTVGGVTGAVTTVGADAVLLPLSVSGVAVVTVTTFVFVPVSLTVALTVIETEAPAAMLPSAQRETTAASSRLSTFPPSASPRRTSRRPVPHRPP